MTSDPVEIQARLVKLRRALASGALRVSVPNTGSIEYRSVTELEAAIRALEGELAGGQRTRRVRLAFSKGLTE